MIAIITAPGQVAPRASISGNVVDASTKKPLPYAIVFLAGTTLGTSTDSAGQFEINNVPLGSHELVASMIGYKRQSFPLQIVEPSRKTLNVQLQSSEVQTQAVEVVAPDPKEWRKNLERFQREFLGQTKNAKQCSIKNPEVVSFVSDPKEDLFQATAAMPFEIENLALGYRIQCFLEEFRIEKNVLQYKAQTRFEELLSRDDAQKEEWQKQRRRSYLGSKQHFFFALGGGTFQQEGFEIISVSTLLPTEETIRRSERIVDLKHYLSSLENDVQKSLSFPDYWQISYLREPPEYPLYFDSSRRDISLSRQVSWIKIDHAPVIFDLAGTLVDPYALSVYGYWAYERVAELLPLEYELK